MRTRIALVVCVLLFGVSGCESTAGNVGLGAGLGGALSNTLSGAKADLERKEQALIELYNQGVADGMAAEDLDELRQDIYDVRLGKEAVDAGESFLGVDWNDPKQTGGALSGLAILAYGIWKRKELAKTTKELAVTAKKYVAHKKVVNDLMINSSPDDAKKIYDDIGKARSNL